MEQANGPMSICDINDTEGHACSEKPYQTHIYALIHPLLACYYKHSLSLPMIHTNMINHCVCVNELHQVTEHLSL